MTSPDPDHVQVMAAQLHAAQCPSGRTYFQFSKRHRKEHDGLATALLTGLANTGYALTTTEAA